MQTSCRLMAASFTLALALLGLPLQATAAGLKVLFGTSGIQTLSYNGVVLEDLGQNPSDAFHIWHMKATDLQGNVLTTGQYGWGEVNNGKSWNAATNSWTYNFAWGAIVVQFGQAGDSLNMNVTVTNLSNSGIVFDGATIYPFVVRFPNLPAGFTDPSYEQLAFNTTAPSVTLADYGQGEVAAVYPDAARPLYSGFQPAGVANSYTPIISGTSIDGMADFFPHNDRPVYPGNTDTYTVSLRFAPSGTSTASLAADAYKNWAQTWPQTLQWSDRRIIGTVYLASSPSGNPSYPAGFPNNPRRYFNDGNSSDFNVTTGAGLSKFQSRILEQAADNVQNLTRLNAQGAITWDIEGEQYPQPTSYVCEPDQIAQTSPEMESVITDPTSPYQGMKLDDAYFKIMRNAGFRVGVCVRPQHFTLNSDGTANQVSLADAQIPAELTRKIQYAHDRWGATLFYVDSTVEPNGAVLDPSIFQQVAAAFPDSLLMPEESTPKHYAYTAPFMSFLFHGSLGTPSDIYDYYPKAFSVNLVNDVDAGQLAQYRPQLTAAVKSGDILMVHADYWQANNPTVVAIYQDAGVGGPAPTLPQTQPALPTAVQITSPNSGQSLSGSIVVAGQINANLDSAGSYLLLDGNEVGTGRVTSAPYAYPLNTSTLSNGSHTLQIWAHDMNNATLLSAPITVTTNNNNSSAVPAPAPMPIQPLPAIPVDVPISLTYPANGSSISGIVWVAGTITQMLDAAGSYLMLDGQEVGSGRITGNPYLYRLDTSTLASGQHTLQLWAHDTNNDTLLSNTVRIFVP